MASTEQKKKLLKAKIAVALHGVPGVIGGKFTVSYNLLFIKWL
jgi:hypothetical protein